MDGQERGREVKPQALFLFSTTAKPTLLFL
jgi:hypothetical protein